MKIGVINIEFQKLTDREQLLMESIWTLGDGVRLAYMVERTNETYGLNWKPQTASTFLNKLVNKGFVSPYRDGQYVHYHILIQEEDYLKYILNQEVDFWTKGDICAYANALFMSRTMSKDEIGIIKNKLDELERALEDK